MRLLLSNDDGLDSPFLPAFARALAKVADLKIVVPSGERSWIGRAYSRHSELEAQPRDFFGLDCQTVSGTPADCVNIALGHLCAEPPDAVISGLNIGQNVAMPLLWSSGTFAAAVEGAAGDCPRSRFRAARKSLLRLLQTAPRRGSRTALAQHRGGFRTRRAVHCGHAFKGRMRRGGCSECQLPDKIHAADAVCGVQARERRFALGLHARATTGNSGSRTASALSAQTGNSQTSSAWTSRLRAFRKSK